MIRKVLLLGVIVSWLFLGAILVLAQTETVVFEKTYHYGSVDVGYYVEPTNDQGYIITGYTSSALPYLYDIYTIKTDRYGDTLWTKIYYAYDRTFYDESFCVRQTTDGGYIISGYVFYAPFSLEGWTRGHLIKTDANGNVVWERIFSEEEMAQCRSVSQTEDGGFIIVGYAERPKPNFADVALMKTDANGNPLWVKYFDSHNEADSQEYPSREWGYWVERTTDNGIIIVGRRTIGIRVDEYNEYDDYDVYLIKTDGNGDSLWAQTYGSTIGDVGYFVQQTNDGGYIMIGTTLTESSIPVYVIKTDALGDTLWTRTYGEEWQIGYGIREISDGGYIMTGVAVINNSDNLYLTKIDTLGEVVWSRLFSGKGEAGGLSVVEADNGFIVTGRTNNDVYLIKTNNEGLITAVSEENSPYLPQNFVLYQNYPNPFNPQTIIQFDVLEKGRVKLEIFNILGQKVRTLVDQEMNNGRYSISWNGKDQAGNLVSSGIYFYRLAAGNYRATQKMVFLK